MCWREGRGIQNFNILSSSGLHSQNVLLTSDLSFKAQVTCFLLPEGRCSCPTSPADHTLSLPLRARSWLTGILHTPPRSRLPQRKARPRAGASILGQAGRIQGRSLLALPLRWAIGCTPNPHRVLVSSSTEKNQSDPMVSEAPSSSLIKGSVNQTVQKVLA